MIWTDLPISPLGDVRLRLLRQSDLAAWFGYLARPEVFEHTSWNVQAHDELLPLVWDPALETPDRALRLAVARADDDALVGTIGFHGVSAANRTAELAYDFSPSVWGRGIASALCRTVVAWGHGHAGLVRVQATVLHTNERSRRVLERCGFAREGLLRKYRMVRGTPGDFYLYAHLAAD